MRLSSLLARAAAAVLTAIMALGLAACGGLEVRSSRTEGVPSVLLGQWQGQWASSGTQGDGTIVVWVQEFDGDPVVSAELDNPCIVPQVYQLSIGGGGSTQVIEAGVLVSAGGVVLPFTSAVWTAVQTPR